MTRVFLLITVLATLPFAIAPGVLAQSVSGEPATAAVEVTVWRRISDPSLLYVSTRPEGGRWRTLNTALDMSMESRSGRFHQSNAVLVEVPLPTTTFTGVFEAVEYTIALEDGWALLWDHPERHTYTRSAPEGHLHVGPTGPLERTLAEYAEWVRDGLEFEIASEWPSYTVFEFTSMEAVTVGEQVFYELRYRRAQGPEYCVVNVVERIAVTETVDGLTAGVRVVTWVCEEEESAYSAVRQVLLDSLQVAARPAE